MKNIPKVTSDLIMLEMSKKLTAIGVLLFLDRYGFHKWNVGKRYAPTPSMNIMYVKFLKQLSADKLNKMYIEILNRQ